MTTPRLGFVEWQEGTTEPNTLHNTLALKTDLFLAGGVKSRVVTAQPGSPAEGDCYIIAATHTGVAWGSFTQNYIAAYYDGAWLQYAPPGRLLTFCDDESRSLQWNGSAWQDPFSMAGIATEAYVDAAVVGLLDHKGTYNASTNSPDLDTSPSGIKKGDAYSVSAAGTFYATAVQAGDWMYALQDNPTSAAHWAIVESNITDAIVDADFSGSEGFMRKTGAGAYEVIKSNLGAAVDPTVNEDSGDGYVIGSKWINTTLNKSFTLFDATVGAAVWKLDAGAFEFTADVPTVGAQDYVLWYDAPFAGSIQITRTKTSSGSCTVTFKVNTTALGGAANSASSSAQEQAHSSANTFVKGDKIQFTVSSNSSALNLAVGLYGVRST